MHATAVICTVDMKKRDTELKVLLGCTAAEAKTITAFLKADLVGCVLIERPEE